MAAYELWERFEIWLVLFFKAGYETSWLYFIFFFVTIKIQVSKIKKRSYNWYNNIKCHACVNLLYWWYWTKAPPKPITSTKPIKTHPFNKTHQNPSDQQKDNRRFAFKTKDAILRNFPSSCVRTQGMLNLLYIFGSISFSFAFFALMLRPRNVRAAGYSNIPLLLLFPTDVNSIRCDPLWIPCFLDTLRYSHTFSHVQCNLHRQWRSRL